MLTQAERVVNVELVERALQLEEKRKEFFNADVRCHAAAAEAVENCDVAIRSLQSSKRDADGKFRVLLAVDGSLPCNKIILELTDRLRVDVEKQIELMGQLKLWIQLSMPRIEDGNNFGVSIQQEVINELSRSEDGAFAILDSGCKYLGTRAKLGTKLLKYGNVEDYKRAIVELDRKEAINLCLCCLDTRNYYITIHDLISKNMEKLKRPRGSGVASTSMY
uniref:Proteasome activator PA28 C-terminal domain-containing protein n=1 Tax=Compsopogon caeruleus TaxID=31354 RepID=A0A7S1T6G8_9RHOD|mmetsp:Transcript_11656/g.23702  ORF Transcript_11656/g.23702 Transcript_11656/m.23702 type:complete len:221 (+) Transcript_11656:234-896(+)